jgi:hypothetical protein
MSLECSTINIQDDQDLRGVYQNSYGPGKWETSYQIFLIIIKLRRRPEDSPVLKRGGDVIA